MNTADEEEKREKKKKEERKRREGKEKGRARKPPKLGVRKERDVSIFFQYVSFSKD